MEFLKGKKTYIISILAVVYAVSGYILGYIELQNAIQLIIGSLGISALRHGIGQ